MIKGVIFDLDGTLAYTLEDLRTGMNLMCEEMGYPLRTTQDILDAVNCGFLEFVRKSIPEEFQSDEELVKKCHQCYSGHYTNHYLDKTVLYDGIEETVKTMKEKGLKLAVLTSGIPLKTKYRSESSVTATITRFNIPAFLIPK